jgi:hypothetical protein
MREKLHYILALLAITTACGRCENDIVSETQSPGGQWKIVIFQRACGATTGFSTQVSVLESAATLGSDGGNVFIADDNHGVVSLKLDHTLPLKVSWKGDHDLEIEYPPGTRIFRQEQKYGSVSIAFSEGARVSPATP